MGKRLIQQRRGRGTSTYKSMSFRYKGKPGHRVYDNIEKEDLVKGKVIDLIHCAGHSAPLAKVLFENGEKHLMFAPEKLSNLSEISSGFKAEVKIGNVLPLKNIPLGVSIFNIETLPGDKGKLVRGAGTSAIITSKTTNKIKIKLPSKKLKDFNPNCRACIGILSGAGKREKPFVKAGNRYHAMKAKNKLYPRTSGVAMNAVDHPFGSGRGRHIGKPKIPPRHAPPGRNVGLLKAKRTGKRK